MQWGICTSVANAAAVKAAGWDFVEENVQSFLQGLVPDDQWQGPQRVKNLALPLPVANSLVPGNIKITGPDASLDKLRPYMATVLSRAGKIGIPTLVFGSGGARNVPDGWDRQTARKQIVDFLRMACPIAASHGVTLVAEPLNKGECNIINSVSEAMMYVREVGHANFECLVDSYHFWLESDKLEDLASAMPHIRHVHLADKDGRVPPGESGRADYRPFFRILKNGGYNGGICVEALGFNDFAGMGPRVLAFVKKQWSEA